MRAAPPSFDIRALEVVPWGDVPLAPRELTGVSRADLARDMAAHLLDRTSGGGFAPDSAAPALTALRRAFPHVPLSARVAALAALMRR